ncbi:MAG TPA: LysR family transcriptional regulator [Polyangiaceae bacterium]|jgi:DNA-binding transcriptional LysR family regulator
MKLSAIDTNLLLALHALLQETSVTRAAKRLGIGQPAMSRSLARLRDHFKDPLLVPKGRQLVLSRAAQALLPAVERAAAAIADVFEEGGGPGLESRRSWVVACVDLFGTTVVPGLVRAIGEKMGATLEVRSIPARSSEQILEDGADVVLGAFEDLPPTVSQRHLFSDSFVCVVRADHPRVGRTMSLKTYLELHHLEVLPAPMARPGLRIERALGSKAGQRRVAVRVPYFGLAARILADSDLVLTMSGTFARALQETLPLKVVAAPLTIPAQRFSLIWHRKHETDRGHAWFRDLVAKVCDERFGNAI